MPKSQLIKGNRSSDTRYHIRYYTKAFFDPSGGLEEGEESESKIGATVKIPVKINADGNDSRSNVTHWEIKAISHFENNVENVLESVHQLFERVIKPKGIEDEHELIMTTIRMMGLICKGGTATQTLQEAGRVARQGVYDEHLREFDEEDEVSKEILLGDELAFIDYINKGNLNFDRELFNDNEH